MEKDYITLDDVMREIAELPTFPPKYIDIKLRYIRAMIQDMMYTSWDPGRVLDNG